MQKSDIKIGEIYCAKVSGKLAHVRVINESIYGGWNCVNLATNRKIRIKSARRFRPRTRL